MKKALLVSAVLLISGMAMAATTQFIETLPPAVVQGAVPVSNGYSWSLTSNPQAQAPMITLPIGTSTYFSTLLPQTTGQMGFCTTCATFNGTKGGLCVSSGTTTGAWIQVSSATAVAACN